jgi:hypothetical protein
LQAARRYGAGYLLLDPDLPLALQELVEKGENYPGMQLVADLGDGYYLYVLESEP